MKAPATAVINSVVETGSARNLHLTGGVPWGVLPKGRAWRPRRRRPLKINNCGAWYSLLESALGYVDDYSYDPRTTSCDVRSTMQSRDV